MYCKIKRFFDIVISALGIILFSFPMVCIMLLIRAQSEGSPLFRQRRVGRNGREFTCLKLRTMYKNAPKLSTAEFYDADKYITPIGRFLRRTSLDELPQLINVLLGDMSLIGPRPLIPEEREVHAERMRRGIYRLRPGITGLAQIKGRDSISDTEKVVWDEEYLRRISFLTDMKIIVFTVLHVAIGKNIADGKNEKKAKG